MKLRTDQLSTHLENPLSPIYLVTGDEPFQSGEVVQSIR